MANSVLHTFTSSVNQPSYDSNPSLSFWLCRGTAFGILNGICKFAAIIASSIFAAFIGITKIIPIFLAFAALVCGGMVALKLPETREKILSWKAKLLQPLGPKRSLAMSEAAYSGESISFLNWHRKIIKKGHVVLDVCVMVIWVKLLKTCLVAYINLWLLSVLSLSTSGCPAFLSRWIKKLVFVFPPSFSQPAFAHSVVTFVLFEVRVKD